MLQGTQKEIVVDFLGFPEMFQKKLKEEERLTWNRLSNPLESFLSQKLWTDNVILESFNNISETMVS